MLPFIMYTNTKYYNNVRPHRRHYSQRVNGQVYWPHVNPSQHQTKVCVIGHSFISRLQQYMYMTPHSQSRGQPNFGLNQINSSFLCKGGWHVSNVYTYLTCLNSPKVIFLQLGENDIPSFTQGFKSVLAVAETLIHLAQACQRATNADKVIIGRLFFRNINQYFLPTTAHVQDYNRKVKMINSYLRVMVPETQHIHYWSHRGAEDMSFLSPDGTHLNPQGTKKLYNSIRGAILHSLSHP